MRKNMELCSDKLRTESLEEFNVKSSNTWTGNENYLELKIEKLEKSKKFIEKMLVAEEGPEGLV